MKFLLGVVLFCVVLSISWPLALLLLVLLPVIFLLSIPFVLLGITLEAVFALIRALLFLPARLLGARV
jgi:hypothetical protein